MHKFLLVVFLAAALPAFAQEEETCSDAATVLALPARREAALRKAQKGWDSGVTANMVDASAGYNAALRGMILELGKTYYATPPTKTQVAELEKAIAVEASFGQDADNPRGETPGSIARVDLAGVVSEGLESMVVRMAKALLEDDPKHPFESWKEEWDKAGEKGE